eukprot:2184208-Amphidinium_carterae.1
MDPPFRRGRSLSAKLSFNCPAAVPPNNCRVTRRQTEHAWVRCVMERQSYLTHASVSAIRCG